MKYLIFSRYKKIKLNFLGNGTALTELTFGKEKAKFILYFP